MYLEAAQVSQFYWNELEKQISIVELNIVNMSLKLYIVYVYAVMLVIVADADYFYPSTLFR